jgi:signal transduction histidine kinase
MVVLLTAVAMLQYRWTNEASRADEIRIGAELESLMMKWHGDFFAEFSAICTAIQVGPDSGARDTWNDYLSRYAEWNDALPHESLPYIYRNPDLVGEIYIWETNQQVTPRLFWLNLARKKIELIAPPPEFSTLLSRLQANSASLSMALSAWKLPGGSPHADEGETPSSAIASTSDSTTGWQFDEDIPAMVHPILHHSDEKSLSSRSPVDWIIITLDMAVLRKRVLPELSSRYFGGLDGLDYKVALVRKGARTEEIYASDAGFGIQQLNAADSTLNIFALPLQGSPGTVPGVFSYRPSLGNRDWHNLTATAWFPVIQYGPATDPWLLELQHRAGPLQLAIEKVRRNNLTLSGLVLLLLALSFAVLTYAGYRAQKFAKLQLDFVASISHELRTPLAAIFSAGENIKDGVIRNQVDLARYGSIVTAQSRQLMNHVDRILTFASIRSGKDHYTLRPLEVRNIVAAVRRNLSPLMAEESCVLEETMQPNLPPVMGDMFAACGCLENLITNAIKYGGSEHRIHLSAEVRNPTGERPEVAISVEDHGMGIDASDLQRIFEPFYRAPAATAAQIHGTGLGLSLAKHLSEAMGGRLTVASQPGSGSIFTLYLQLAPKQNHTIPTESTEALIR